MAIGPWWLACSAVTCETIGVAKLCGVILSGATG
jgi:hypothetical protein